MPAVAKILIVFVAMLLLVRARLHLGIALVVGGIGLDLWAGRGVSQTAADMGVALRAPSLWLYSVTSVTSVVLSALPRRFQKQAQLRASQALRNSTHSWPNRRAMGC